MASSLEDNAEGVLRGGKMNQQEDVARTTNNSPANHNIPDTGS